MKKFEELKYEERKEIELLFANWLKNYSHEVIIKVIAKRDKIINNEFTIKLLRELMYREEEEDKDFLSSISTLLDDFERFKEFDPHSHPITHSESYRDILRDMYFA